MEELVFLKQKTAYEMRISDWSSDVCSSDLAIAAADQVAGVDGQAGIGRMAQGFTRHARGPAGVLVLGVGEVQHHQRRAGRARGAQLPPRAPPDAGALHPPGVQRVGRPALALRALHAGATVLPSPPLRTSLHPTRV